jgi:hypothetical protein
MIQFISPLTLDSTILRIATIALTLVIAVHVYLRQLIRKQSHVNQLPALFPA